MEDLHLDPTNSEDILPETNNYSSLESHKMPVEAYKAEALAILEAGKKLKIFGDYYVNHLTAQLDEDLSTKTKHFWLEERVKVLREAISNYNQNYPEYKKASKGLAFETRDRVQNLSRNVLPKLAKQFDQATSQGIEMEVEQMIDGRYELGLAERRNLGLVDPRASIEEFRLHYQDFILEHPDFPSYSVFSDQLANVFRASEADNSVMNVQEIKTNGESGPVWTSAEIAYNDSVQYTHHQTFETPFMNLIGVPVGEYGANLGSRLGKTTLELATLTKQLQPDFEVYQAQIGTDVVDKFVRSNDNNKTEPSLMLSTYEGFLSIQQALSMLTAQKIEGYAYRGDDKLLNDLFDSGMVDQLARILPFAGYVGPMALQGIYFNNILRFEEGKGFVMNRELIKKFHDERIILRTSLAVHSDKPNEQGRLLTGCPAALRSDDGTTSISEFGKLFMKVFEATS